MKKRLFVSFLAGSIVFAGTLLSAQAIRQDETRFQKDRKVSRGRGVTALKSRAVAFTKKEFSIDTSKGKAFKRVYIKLKQPLTKALDNKLESNGINLKEYVADDTYIVELNENKLNKLKNIFSVTGFAEIDFADKLSERLYKENFSNHAKDGNYVKVIASFYDDISYSDAISLIKSVGAIIESKDFSRTYKLRIAIPQSNLQKLAELDVVKYVDEIAPPSQTHNIDAGKLSEVFWGNNTGLFDTGYSLTGLGVNVAVKDGGAIYAHSDFGNRLTIVDNDSVSSHATHVAGTIGGELDIQNNIGGMAEHVDIFSYSYSVDGNAGTTETDFTVDYVSAVNNSISIVNNSWGRVIGWFWNPYKQPVADWDNEDSGLSGHQSLFGDYTSESEDMDDFIYDYFDNNALILKSAGNDRGDGPDQINHDGDYLTDNEGIASGHYRCIEPLSCSKNNIAVGSVGLQELSQIFPKKSSFYSVWGPTEDGRVKPDVVADGWKLKSTWDNDGYYGEPYGTSMSCPVVTGVCALIHQSYSSVYGKYPTADIVKALLCNFAEDLGKKGPDFAYGFGLVNAKRCVDHIDNEGYIVTGVIAEADDYMEYQFTIGENETENQTVTLAWIDPAANPSATNAIVNDLDISISCSSNAYLPFYHKDYDDAPGMGTTEPTVDPTEPAKIGYNRYDTVEQILIEPDNTGVIPAGTYTVRVSGFKVPILNQPFAVVSSVRFNDLNYNVLKVKGAEGIWVSNQFSVLDKNPDILMMVTYFDTSSSPSNVQYAYSTNGGANWSGWSSVTGVYEDEDCTESDNTSTPVAFIKKDSVPFDTISMTANRVKFRLTYNGQTKESAVYTVKNDNNYYVSATSGDDTTGKGTMLNPWETLNYAMGHVVATAQVPAIIRVQEGTYNENIELDEYIYLQGGYSDSWFRDIDNNETIIQGDGMTHVVIGADHSRLDGFTVQGGSAQYGGGIYLYQTSPIIENCTIQDNYAEDNSGSPVGAGIYAYASEAVLKNCIITGNKATITVSSTNGFGGGACFVSSSIQVEKCIFEGNEINTTTGNPGVGYGGGLYLENDNSSIISTLVKSNTVDVLSNERGGGICINSGSTTKILSSVIYENNCLNIYYGDGIICFNAPDVHITNCTVYGNDQIGIWLNTSSCYITNTIVWNHYYPGVDTDIYGPSGVLNSSKITYCCTEDGIFEGINGNIDDNPQFRDASSGDFRILNTSPCIDAGNDDAPSLNLSSQDFHGQKRIFEFDNSGTESVDIGADEYAFGFLENTGIGFDNDGIKLEWESIQGTTYNVEYLDNGIFDIPSPVLHLRMNDNDSSATVTDSTGSNNGIFYSDGSESDTDGHDSIGQINASLSFDGVDDHISCGDIANFTGNFTFSCWLYIDEPLPLSENRYIISKTDNGYWIRIETDGKIGIGLHDTGGTNYYSTSSAKVTAEEWVYLVVSVDIPDEEIRIYINCGLAETIDHTVAGIQTDTAPVIIGAYTAGSTTQRWSGCLDDIRIYDSVLNKDQIGRTFNMGYGTEQTSFEWVRLEDDIAGLEDSTSWTDDGTEISPSYDDDTVTQRYYRVFFEN
ncbi:MAG: S8 family serine peptidase [Candidatus Auribacterota bacterium]|jgi:hypothetical protein|nr:S8 family serine peptidase [Candidatus Auribacterota bacterium]